MTPSPKYIAEPESFEPLKPVEIANILLQLKLENQLTVLENLERETSSEVLNNLQGSPSILGNIVKQMSPDRLTNAVENMPQDDAADFVGFRGIGLYAGRIHVDMRPTKRVRWIDKSWTWL